MSEQRSTFEITTPLAAPASEVWDYAVSPDGISYELGPWVGMTMPEGIKPGMTIDDAPLGEKLGRSWIKVAVVPARRRTGAREAGGVRWGLPVDYDDLCLVEKGPGMRFLERSELGSASFWQHEREVIPTGETTCEMRDRLEIEVRTPLRKVGGMRIAPRVVRTLFTHRHKRLVQRWGQ